jgi:hypothetical protein
VRTYPIVDHSGHMFAFEIEHVYVGRGRLARVLREIDGVSSIRVVPRFGDSPDVRVQFVFRGRKCMVWEPYGDSSRYWIGPEEPEAGPFDISAIEKVVRWYEVPPLAQLIGDLLSLRLPFLSRA